MERQVEADPYIMEKKQTCKRQRLSTMEGDCFGSQGPERTVAFQEEEKEKKKKEREQN